MRIYRVLLTPWVATPRSARWLFVFVLTLLALGAVLGNVFGIAERVWVFNAVMLGVANALCWLLLLPNGLLLAMAARRLRVPGINRDAVWSLPLYAALGIGVPMLFQFQQDHVLEFAVVQLLAAVGAMLFMALPYYFVMVLSLLLVISHQALSHVISIPGLFDPRFVRWGSTVAVIGLAVLAWRWRQLLRGGCRERGLGAPGMVFFQRNLSRAQSDPLTDAASMRIRPDWLLARPNLHDVGPHRPTKSLRMALGGVYLPQTIIGHLYQWAFAVLSLTLMGLVFFGVTFGDQSVSDALHYVVSLDGFVAASWMFTVFALAFVMQPVELLTLRWGRVNAELPLLALLPRLARAGGSKRLLLRTVIDQAAARLGLLLLLGWLGVSILHLGWPVALAMLVVAVGCLAYLYAMALSIFGGRPLSGFGKSLLLLGMFVVLSATVLLPQLGDGLAAPLVARAGGALVAAWLALALFLWWLARRGGGALHQRPHPFLAH